MPDKKYKNVRALQKFLKKEGYDPGSIDNSWGPNTEKAFKLYMSQNPQYSGVAADPISSAYKLLPLPLRSFIEDIGVSQFNKLSPIDIQQDALTEGDLNSRQMESLRGIVRKKLANGQTNISYSDYGTNSSDSYEDVSGRASNANIASKGFFDPSYQLKTTLGQADIFTTPTDTFVVDQGYNFNDGQGKSIFNPFAWKDAAYEIGSNPSLYTVPRKLAKQFGSVEGEGRGALIKTTEYKNGGSTDPTVYNSDMFNESTMLPEVTLTDTQPDQANLKTIYDAEVAEGSRAGYNGGFAPDPTGMGPRQLLRLATNFPKFMKSMHKNYKGLGKIGDGVQNAYLKAKQVVDLGLYGMGKEKSAIKTMKDLKGLMGKIDKAGDIIGPNRYKLMPKTESLKQGLSPDDPISMMNEVSGEVGNLQRKFKDFSRLGNNTAVPKADREQLLILADRQSKGLKVAEEELDNFLTGKFKAFEDIDMTLQRSFTPPSTKGVGEFMPSNRNLELNPLNQPRFQTGNTDAQKVHNIFNGKRLTPGESIILDQYKNPFKMNKYGGKTSRYSHGGPHDPPALAPTGGTQSYETPLTPAGTPEGEFDQSQQWYQDYIQSPEYRARLASSGYEDVDATRDARLTAVNDATLVNSDAEFSAMNPLTSEMQLHPDYSDGPTQAHEMSHTAGASLDPSQGDVLDTKALNATDVRWLEDSNKNWQEAEWRDATVAGESTTNPDSRFNGEAVNPWNAENLGGREGIAPGTKYSENTGITGTSHVHSEGNTYLRGGGDRPVYGVPTKDENYNPIYPEGYPTDSKRSIKYQEEIEKEKRDLYNSAKKKTSFGNIKTRKSWDKRFEDREPRGYDEWAGEYYGDLSKKEQRKYGERIEAINKKQEFIDKNPTNRDMREKLDISSGRFKTGDSHDIGAEESKADLDGVRYYGSQTLGWDPAKKTSQSDLDLLKKTYKESGDSNVPMDRMFENYSDEDILLHLNNIAMESPETGETVNAKYGGKVMRNRKKYPNGGRTGYPKFAASGSTTGLLGQSAESLGAGTPDPGFQLGNIVKPVLMGAGMLVGGPAGAQLGAGIGEFFKPVGEQDLGQAAMNLGSAGFSAMQNNPDAFRMKGNFTDTKGVFGDPGQVFKGKEAFDMNRTGMSNFATNPYLSGLYAGDDVNIPNMNRAKHAQEMYNKNNPYPAPQLRDGIPQRDFNALQAYAMGGDIGGQIEAEGGEYFVSDTNESPISLGNGNIMETSDGMYKFGGPNHSEGGMPMNAPEGYIHTKRFLSNKPLGKKYKAKNDAKVVEAISKQKASLESFGTSKADMTTKMRMSEQLDRDLALLRESAEQYKASKGINSAGEKIAAYGSHTQRFATGGQTDYSDMYSQYTDDFRDAQKNFPKEIMMAQYMPAFTNMFAGAPDEIKLDRMNREYEDTDFSPMIDRYLQSTERSTRDIQSQIQDSGLTGGRKLAALTSMGAKGSEEKGKIMNYVSELKLKDKALKDKFNVQQDVSNSELALKELMLNLQQEGATANQRAEGIRQFSTATQNSFWDPLKFMATGTPNFNPGGKQSSPYYSSGGSTGGTSEYLDSFYRNILNKR